MGTMVLHCLDERLHDFESHRPVGKDLWQEKLRRLLSTRLLRGQQVPR
jgi:hypothetical protein